MRRFANRQYTVSPVRRLRTSRRRLNRPDAEDETQRTAHNRDCSHVVLSDCSLFRFRSETAMQALLFDGQLRLVHDYPEPSALPGEAIIRPHLVGICNTDIEITR